MEQLKMSKYLKTVTLVIGILFFLFVVWFLPSVIRQLVLENFGKAIYWSTCSGVWLTSIPCFLCLWKFWGICVRIGKDESFCRANAAALRHMSYFMLLDCILYTLILAAACVGKWYIPYGISLLFGILLIFFICISLTVICASLSHLVYKASQLQEEQDLTI